MTYEPKYEVVSYLVNDSASSFNNKGNKPLYTVSTKQVVLPIFLELRREYNPMQDADKFTFKMQIDGAIEFLSIMYQTSLITSIGDAQELINFLASSARKHLAKHSAYQGVPPTIIAAIHQRVLSFLNHVHENNLINTPAKTITSFKPNGGIVSGSIYIQGNFSAGLTMGDFGVTDAIYEVSRKSQQLPGVDARVVYPCVCNEGRISGGKDTIAPRVGTLWGAIQHLNDRHTEWTREKIADWMDALHDSGEIDIEFKPDFDAKKKPVKNDSDTYASQFNKPVTITANKPQVVPEGWTNVGWTSQDGYVSVQPPEYTPEEMEKMQAAWKAEIQKLKLFAEDTKNNMYSLGEETKKTTEAIKGLNAKLEIIDEVSGGGKNEDDK